MAQLRLYYDDFKALNTDVTLITFETGHWLQMWLADAETPYSVLLDPARQAYQAYGLERSRLRALSLNNLWYYLRARLAGRRSLVTGADTAQLGGDFIVDTAGIVRLAHRSHEPTDRPPVAELLALLRQLAG